MKKIKYWQRNSGLKFWPEENITSFSIRAIFVRTLHIFSNPTSKMFCNFSLKSNLANRGHFLALWARKLKDALNKRKTKFALTCNVKKVIRALAFRSRKKFANLFLFKIVGIV